MLINPKFKTFAVKDNSLKLLLSLHHKCGYFFFELSKFPKFNRIILNKKSNRTMLRRSFSTLVLYNKELTMSIDVLNINTTLTPFRSMKVTSHPQHLYKSCADIRHQLTGVLLKLKPQDVSQRIHMRRNSVFYFCLFFSTFSAQCRTNCHLVYDLQRMDQTLSGRSRHILILYEGGGETITNTIYSKTVFYFSTSFPVQPLLFLDLTTQLIKKHEGGRKIIPHFNQTNHSDEGRGSEPSNLPSHPNNTL